MKVKVRWMLVGALLLALLSIAPATHAQSRNQGPERGGGVRIALHGSRAFPQATGSAKSKASAEERELEVQVEHVPVLAGKTLAVFVDNTRAGTLMINNLGSGALNLNTQLGQAVPNVHRGSVVRVFTPSGHLVVTGRFPI